MKRLQKDWINITILAMTFIALLLAIQANLYSRKSVTANLVIMDDQEYYSGSNTDKWGFWIDGCKNFIGGNTLRFHSLGKFWIRNDGGLDTSLIKVHLYVENKPEAPSPFVPSSWSVGLIKGDDPYQIELEEYVYQLNIPSGSLVPINVHAAALTSFRRTSEVYDYLEDSLYNSLGIKNELALSGIWEFEFSDGTVINKIYNKATFPISNPFTKEDLSTQLEKLCGEQP